MKEVCSYKQNVMHESPLYIAIGQFIYCPSKT